MCGRYTTTRDQWYLGNWGAESYAVLGRGGQSHTRPCGFLKSKPIPGPHLVYGFLTTSPNAIVEPIHSKAMPAILTTDVAGVDRGPPVRIPDLDGIED
jgi:hypothetical protein